METVKFLLSTYAGWVTSWWWLVLGSVTLLASIVFIIKDDNSRLTTWEAVKFSIAGVVSIIPLVGKLVPNIVVLDLLTRWMRADVGCSFRLFVLWFAFLAFLFAPVLFLLFFGAKIGDHWDDFMKTELGAELRDRGVVAVVKSRLWK